MTSKPHHWLEPLERDGWVHLPSAPDPEELVAALGARILFTTDVVVKEGRALVTSDRALDFHTDHHRADLIAWRCLMQTSAGGETLLADGLAAFESLPVETRETLSTVLLFEHSVFEGDASTHPLVEPGERGPRLYCSFWFPDRPALTEPQRAAVGAFHEAVRRHQVAKIRLAPGDALIIDNRRILHGRTAITGSRDRHLVRHWLARAPVKRQRGTA